MLRRSLSVSSSGPGVISSSTFSHRLEILPFNLMLIGTVGWGERKRSQSKLKQAVNCRTNKGEKEKGRSLLDDQQTFKR